jgi:hypothetical protein
MTRKALLIGIDYIDIPEIKLNGCIDDILNMRNMLVDAFDYHIDDITMLRDDDADNMPTRDNIMKYLNALVIGSDKFEEIWVHYSGHGSQIPDKKTFKPSGLDDILVPIDYSTNGFIADIELLEIIKDIKCRAIFIFDCCHSGTICDLQWSFEYISPSKYTRTKIDNIIIDNPNIYVLSSCKDNQTSQDIYSDKFKQSVGAFSLTFLERLRNANHNIPIMLLYRDICYYMKKWGYTQTPILSSSNSEPNFVFYKPTNHEGTPFEYVEFKMTDN